MYRSQLATFGSNLIPGMTFSLTGKDNFVYLTFDDGPHPETTPRILELLSEHDAKATFFCLGQNVEKYPAVYDSILTAGHAAGNHSWSHPNGWITTTGKYLKDAERASEVISSRLFRPPYGRITPGQWRQLRKKYEIIMWTRQFADYRSGFKADQVRLSRISPGDILVLHDSVKTSANTLLILRKLLKQEKKTSSPAAYKAINH